MFNYVSQLKIINLISQNNLVIEIINKICQIIINNMILINNKKIIR